MTDGIRFNFRRPVDCSRAIGGMQSTRSDSVTPFTMRQSDQASLCGAVRQPTLDAIRVQVEQAAASGIDRRQIVEQVVASELNKAFGRAVNSDMLKTVLDRALHDPSFSHLLSQVLQATPFGSQVVTAPSDHKGANNVRDC